MEPGPLDQLVHTVGISQTLDVWAKRNARLGAASQSAVRSRLLVQDALREIAYRVRSSYADLVREEAESEMSREMKARYDDTIRLSRARFSAGEISEAELRKIELEGLVYDRAVVDAQTELELARQSLAELLGFGTSTALPGKVVDAEDPREPPSMTALTDRALAGRPDLRAAEQGRAVAEASLTAARREAYPDPSLGVAYTHSGFTVSGDNPNSLALTLSMPLPLFDRNQANVALSQIEQKRADNDAARIKLQIEYEVAEAVKKLDRASKLLDMYEQGGMLGRAENALKVAERSYKSGAISLLELLEAQRTYLDTRAQYLRARYEYVQGTIDIRHAVGEAP
jgi:cobalt-zinc-cadmium efflux system outer membrane protein